MDREIKIEINELNNNQCKLLVKQDNMPDQVITVSAIDSRNLYSEALGQVVITHDFQVDQIPLKILSHPTKSDDFVK